MRFLTAQAGDRQQCAATSRTYSITRSIIDAGETILRRDARNALDEQDYNMVVRRVQEAVELTLKGALKMLGADYPRVHDPAPVFSRNCSPPPNLPQSGGGVDPVPSPDWGGLGWGG